ncbi:hypothetical protein H1230_09535 [Paenibacillus sp. 19GGS1-52]|uniref:sacsin N-terminal ATP-binding-like domain-containing protein n=1 Tax=Paenibacillus sp. 19GGS1-52 TaxID=2758563 RepID=UPI001EFBF546|nr:hypothetical protein [Paenibacillus sp. 19GGS1-52]ULO08983.1 hypothetical protein H1230_09535 [Paenibacillus sp. 19GGS1-52]
MGSDNMDRKDLIDISANKINKELYDVFNGSDDNTVRRWIWELIQNACDTSSTPVDIYVQHDIEKKMVSFSHTGDPFDNESLRGLILQKSSKTEDIEKGGQFGTGFITTHLLSKKINITGTFINKNKERIPLDFNLDRSNWENSLVYKEAIPILKAHISEALEELDKIDETPASDGNLANITTFRYALESLAEHHDENKSPVVQGIMDLEKNIPLLLSFSRKIKSIEINGVKYIRNRDDDYSKNEFVSFSKVRINENPEEILLIKHLKMNFEIAVIYKNKTIMRYPENSSRIYCRYPLIGSEYFGLPFVINAESFQVTDHRDSLQIHNTNNIILDEAILLYGRIIDFLISDSFRDIHNLCYMEEKNNTDKLSQKYCLESKNIYCKKPIIETANGGMKSMQEIKFPFIFNVNFNDEIKQEMDTGIRKNFIKDCQKDFYDLMMYCSNIDLPKYELCESLYKIYKESHLSIQKVIELILPINNGLLNNLKVNAFEWLNQFIDLLQKLEISIWKDEKIFVNQKNLLCTLSNRFIDEIDVTLRGVYTGLLNETEIKAGDLENKLIHKNLDLSKSIFKDLIGKFGNKDIAVQITDIITKKLSEEKSRGSLEREKTLQDTYDKLFFWMLEHEEDSKNIFPVLFGMRMDLCSNSEHIDNYFARLEKDKFLEETNSDSLDAAKSKIIDLKKELNEMQEKINGLEKTVEIEKNIDLKLINEFEGMDVTEILENLAKLSIYNETDMQRYLDYTKQTPERKRAFLKYISTGLSEYYQKIQEMLSISEQRVSSYLISNGYKLESKRKIAPTAYDTIKNKDGDNIILIIRPSNKKKVIFYYDSEPNFLRTNSELWVVDTDNPTDIPRQLTLGDILLVTQIKVIPLKNLFV